MYKSFLVLVISAFVLPMFVLTGCGKKDDKPTVTPNDNRQNQQQTNKNSQQQTTQQQTTQQQTTQQQTTQQQTTQQQTTQNQNTASGSFAVKSIGNSDAKNQMVDFTWNENGTDKKLSDYKGKVILLNFWATWCPPCKKELPALSEIHNELKDKNFKMIGISVDDNQDVLNSYLKSNGLPYTVVFEPTELVGKYMTAAGQTQNVVPQTYIIDKNGKLVETILGARSKQDFLTIINKYL